jgi:hypothetical protein
LIMKTLLCFCGATVKASSSATLGKPLVLTERLEQLFHIVGVLLLFGEDLLHRDPCGGIVIAKISNYLVIGLDRDPLSDKILPNHV